MKAVACLVALCLFVGIVSADKDVPAWEEGWHYYYDVTSRALSGITGFADRYNGLQLSYTHRISWDDANVVKVETLDLKIIEVDENLPQGWMKSPITNGTRARISEDLISYMTLPMRLTFENGVIKSIQVQKRLPNWAINIKKAQASTFILNLVKKQNKQEVQEQEVNQEAGSFYKVFEQTVHGECEVNYVISQNQPFAYPYQFQQESQDGAQSGSGSQENQVSGEQGQGSQSGSSSSSSEESQSQENSVEKPWPEAYGKLCRNGDKVFEIIKTVNFTNCRAKPILAFASPSELYYRPGDNAGGSLWARALTSRLLVCGQNLQKYTILKVSQHEEFLTGLRDVEKVHAGALKNITLVKIERPGASYGGGVQPTLTPQPTRRSNFIDIDNLVYKFSHGEQQRHLNRTQGYESQGQGKEFQKLPLPTMHEAPLVSMLITPLNREEMLKRANDSLVQIVEDFMATRDGKDESIAKSETISKLSVLVKTIRLLDTNQIRPLVHSWFANANIELPEEKNIIGRDILYEILAIAGTNPALRELYYRLRCGHFKGAKAAAVVASLPMYIRYPTEELLEKMFGLLEEPEVKKHDQLHTSAILAYTTLLHQACVNKRIKNTRYPVALYGEFCSPQFAQRKADYFIEKFQQHWQRDLPEQKHWQFVYLKALENIGVPNIIPVIQKVLDQESQTILKTKAIGALKNLLQSRQYLNQKEGPVPVDRQSNDLVTDEIVEKHVLPILASAAFDRGEHPEVRVAAFNSLFRCSHADVAIWQQIAMSTWSEPIRDIQAFIRNTILHLAQIRVPLTPAIWNQVQKARKVITLVRPISPSVARSNNLYTSEFVHPINTGFGQNLQYTASEDSVLFPNNIHYKNVAVYGNGGAAISPLEVAFTGQTISKLMYAAYEDILQKCGYQQEGRQGNSELSKIRDILGIQTRSQDYPVVGNLFINVRNEMQRMLTFNEDTVGQIAQQLVTVLSNSEILSGNGSFTQFGRMAEQSASMPTLLGFPLVYKKRVSSLLHVRAQFQLANPSGPGVQVQADISSVYAWKLNRGLAFKVPFLQKKFQAGVQRHIVLEVPVSIVARKAPGGQIQLAVTPQPLNEELKGSPKGYIDVVTYHQRPYVAKIHDEFHPITVPAGGQLQIVRVDQKPFSRNTTVRPLGFALEIQEESDFPKQAETLPGWVRFLRLFHTPGCAMTGSWFGSSSIRYVERKLTLNLEQSKARTALLVAGAKLDRVSVVEKLQDSQEILDGSFESSESSESNESNANCSTEVNTPRREKIQKENVIAVALLGKVDPLKTLKEGGAQGSTSSEESASQEQQQQQQQQYQGEGEQQGNQLQRPLQKGSENVEQFLVILNPALKGELFLQISAGAAAYKSAQNLTRVHPIRGVRDSLTSTGTSQSSVCVQLDASLKTAKEAPRHVLDYTRKYLLNQNLNVTLQALLRGGQDCEGENLSFLSVRGQFQRDQEMTEWAQTKSPKAQRCQADEKKGFSVSQVCLEVAREQAAALNEMKFNIVHSAKMPRGFKNAVAWLENTLKVIGYPYISEGAPSISNTLPNQMKVWVRITPDKEFYSVHINKPQEVIKFENVPTTKSFRTVFPLTATNTVVRNIQRRLFRSQLHPTCQLEKNWVNTFDNVTYSFSPKTVQNCQTLLVKDCSGRYPMAVYASNIQQQLNGPVTVLLGQQTHIQLLTRGPRTTAIVNGKIVSLPYIVKAKGLTYGRKPIAEIMQVPNGGVQVIGRRIQVLTDGQRILLKLDDLLRNRTCGICGDLNNEKLAEMRSPKDAPLSSGSLFVASYSFALAGKYQNGKPEQCKINPKFQRQAEKEEELFQPNSGSQYTSKNQQRGQENMSQEERFRQQQQKQQQELQGQSSESNEGQQQGPQSQESAQGFNQQQNQQSGSQEQPRLRSPFRYRSRNANQGRQQSEQSSSEEQSQFGGPSRFSSRNANRGQQRNNQQRQQQQQQQQAHQQTGYPQGHQQSTYAQRQQQSQSGSQERQQQQFSQSGSQERQQQRSSESGSQERQQQRSSQSGSQERPQQQSQSKSSSSESQEGNRRPGSKFVLKQLVLPSPQNPRMKCISVNKIRTCASGYRAQKLTQKQVSVHCMHQGAQTRKLVQKIRQGRFVDLFSRPHHKIRVAVPQVCVRA